MKRIFCLLCLITISALSVFMVSASEEQIQEPAFIYDGWNDFIIVETIPPEKRGDLPLFKIVNAETGEVYSSEEEFYEKYGRPEFAPTDLVHHIKYMIPSGPNSVQLLREIHEKIRNQITEEGLDPFTLK